MKAIVARAIMTKRGNLPHQWSQSVRYTEVVLYDAIIPAPFKHPVAMRLPFKHPVAMHLPFKHPVAMRLPFKHPVAMRLPFKHLVAMRLGNSYLTSKTTLQHNQKGLDEGEKIMLMLHSDCSVFKLVEINACTN